MGVAACCLFASSLSALSAMTTSARFVCLLRNHRSYSSQSTSTYPHHRSYSTQSTSTYPHHRSYSTQSTSTYPHHRSYSTQSTSTYPHNRAYSNQTTSMWPHHRSYSNQSTSTWPQDGSCSNQIASTLSSLSKSKFMTFPVHIQLPQTTNYLVKSTNLWCSILIYEKLKFERKFSI